MCIGLVKLKMMDEKIVLDVDLDNTKHVDDVDLCRNALETHAQEDITQNIMRNLEHNSAQNVAQNAEHRAEEAHIGPAPMN